MGAALTQLIPTAELAPGAVGAIRNQVVQALILQASSELHLPVEKLVVRDIRPVEDLAIYSTGTTASSINDWIFTTANSTVTGYVTLATGNMADQRYCGIYGVRDLRGVYDSKTLTSVATVAYGRSLAQAASLVKVNVGGADKIIWDMTSIQSYPNEMVGVSPSAAVIPQNTAYTISIYKSNGVASVLLNIMLLGVVVEPRGKVVSP